MSIAADPTPPVPAPAPGPAASARVWSAEREAGLKARAARAIAQAAAVNLDEQHAWWQRIDLGDPHKYLTPTILARLTAAPDGDHARTWQVWSELDAKKPDVYHFRSIADVRIWGLHRGRLPPAVAARFDAWRKAPTVFAWMATGTENHMFMQRASGLALLDAMPGGAAACGDPATPASIEAWLRAELVKFLSIGQGEFHSTTYYGYAIAGLLNLYDFAVRPELKALAAALLDWYAANLAARLFHGTCAGAESRGFDLGTWTSGAAAVAWIWWGDADAVAATRTLPDGVLRLALYAGTSTYRPPEWLRPDVVAGAGPATVRAWHPGYYSYTEARRMSETLWRSDRAALSTLIEPERSLGKGGTIRGQHAVCKLVVRGTGADNLGFALGGTFHSAFGHGRSPGDQFVQDGATVLYRAWLSDAEIAAGVPARSVLALPDGLPEVVRSGDWWLWTVAPALTVALWARAERVALETVEDKKQPRPVLAMEGHEIAAVLTVLDGEADPAAAVAAMTVQVTAEGDRPVLSLTRADGTTVALVYDPAGAVATQRPAPANVAAPWSALVTASDAAPQALPLAADQGWPAGRVVASARPPVLTIERGGVVTVLAGAGRLGAAMGPGLVLDGTTPRWYAAGGAELPLG